MALTVTVKDRTIFGNKRLVIAEIAFDSSYATGGESLTADMLGLAEIDHLIPSPKSGYLFEYDYTNLTLMAYYPTKAQAVAASSSNQPTVTSGSATASAVSSTTPTVTIPSGFRSAVDTGPGQEVTASANLSTLTGVRVLVIGA
jgi:hypothetical protein